MSAKWVFFLFCIPSVALPILFYLSIFIRDILMKNSASVETLRFPFRNLTAQRHGEPATFLLIKHFAGYDGELLRAGCGGELLRAGCGGELDEMGLWV